MQLPPTPSPTRRVLSRLNTPLVRVLLTLLALLAVLMLLAIFAPLS